jgi:hypothetical protein
MKFLESLIPTAIHHEPQVLSSHVDLKHVFHIIKTNSNTLKHLVSKEIDKFHHILLAWIASVL